VREKGSGKVKGEVRTTKGCGSFGIHSKKTEAVLEKKQPFKPLKKEEKPGSGERVGERPPQQTQQNKVKETGKRPSQSWDVRSGENKKKKKGLRQKKNGTAKKEVLKVEQATGSEFGPPPTGTKTSKEKDTGAPKPKLGGGLEKKRRKKRCGCGEGEKRVGRGVGVSQKTGRLHPKKANKQSKTNIWTGLRERKKKDTPKGKGKGVGIFTREK